GWWRRRRRNIIRCALAPDTEMFRRQDLFDALQIGLSDGFARADFALSGPDRIVVFRMIVVFRTLVGVRTQRRSVGCEVRLLFEGILIFDRVGLLVKRMIGLIWKIHGRLHCLGWPDLTKGPCGLSLLALSRLPPFEEVFEQSLALFRSERTGCGRSALGGHVGVELLTLVRHGRHAVVGKPFLGGVVALPAGYDGGEIGLFPFRMARRLLEIRDARKEGFDKARDALIAVGVLAPVIGDKHAGYRDRVDLLAGRDQVRIVFVREHGG